MIKKNYQKMMDDEINSLNSKPKLLLHACCGPCSSYVLEALVNYFDITIIFYNPNISPESEFYKRYKEVEKLLKLFPDKVKLCNIGYDYNDFLEISKGLEHEKEGGKRCFKCYELRLRKSAMYAKEHGFDYFCTTLSISPYKNADWLNEIGEFLGKEFNINYLYSDFKKKNGYKKSIELSKKYNLYRQDYCGCIYSKIERMSK